MSLTPPPDPAQRYRTVHTALGHFRLGVGESVTFTHDADGQLRVTRQSAAGGGVQSAAHADTRRALHARLGPGGRVNKAH